MQLPNNGGVLQTDGYKGYAEISAKEGILDQIALLYKTEKEAKARNLEGESLIELRQSDAKPVFGRIVAKLEELQPKVQPTGLLGKAVNYLF